MSMHVLINGLSMGGGGGLTVGRELLRHLAWARPDWLIALAAVEGNPLHEELRSETLPPNARLHWAPADAAKRLARRKYESNGLRQWCSKSAVSALLQLNGMMVPAISLPTLCHMQDPLPYRPQAWNSYTQRVTAMLKRRAHRRTLDRASAVGFTSGYLRDLICGHFKINPRISEVFYNGVSTAWAQRVEQGLPSWDDRPHEIITVSDVCYYKRQWLVIDAMAELLKRPGLSDLRYRIIGGIERGHRRFLEDRANRLGISDHVIIEGRVTSDHLQRLWRQARAFVLMSVCESFGIPAIEAMSFGTPVIVADCCAMPEVCGEAAELVPVDDAVALADRIERVLKDPGRAEQLRQLGARRVPLFSWCDTGQRMARTLEAITTEPK